MRAFDVGVVDFPVGPAFEDLFEGHPGFHPGQRRAEAEVQALPEAEVAALTVMSKRSGSGKRRWSRLAEPLSSNMNDPSGTTRP